jgi:hypothetical protein
MLKMIDLTRALQIWTRIGGVAECFFADRTISRDEGLRAYRIASIGRICRILSLVILASAPVAADDGLRIETEVFVPEQVQPISHNLTLVRSATVYDFLLNDPLEVAVFDRERGQFSILQVKQKTKTTFDSQELLQRMDRMRVLARSSGPLIQFSAYPEFDYQFDAARSRMSFTSPLVKYVLDVMRPDNVDMVHRYRDFSDWYTMLNALRPGMRPPHARMEVNKRLADEGSLPKQVQLELTVGQGPSAKTRSARSVHQYGWELTAEDRARIDTADLQLQQFQALGPEEYHRRLLVKSHN